MKKYKKLIKKVDLFSDRPAFFLGRGNDDQGMKYETHFSSISGVILSMGMTTVLMLYFISLVFKFNNTDKDTIKMLTDTNDFTTDNDFTLNDYVMMPSIDFTFMDNMEIDER